MAESVETEVEKPPPPRGRRAAPKSTGIRKKESFE